MNILHILYKRVITVWSSGYAITPLLHACTPLWSLLITVSPTDICSLPFPDCFSGKHWLTLWDTPLKVISPLKLSLNFINRVDSLVLGHLCPLTCLQSALISSYFNCLLSCVSFLPFLHACMLSHFSPEPTDCSPPASSIHEILQARILVEWAAMPSSRGPSWPGDRIRVSYISYIGRWILYQ